MKNRKNHEMGYSVIPTIQKIIIAIFPVCFLMIMQRVNIFVYQVGIVMLILNAIMQIIFGNISEEADSRGALIGFIKNGLIVVVVFVIGILLAPSLVQLGR